MYFMLKVVLGAGDSVDQDELADEIEYALDSLGLQAEDLHLYEIHHPKEGRG